MNISKKRKMKKKMEPYAFLVPLLLIILVFLIVPIVKAAIMSFQYYYIRQCWGMSISSIP